MELGDRVAQIELESLDINPKVYYFWSIYAKLGVVTDIEKDRIRVVFDGDLIWLPRAAVAKHNSDEFKKKEKHINDLHKRKLREFVVSKDNRYGMIIALHPTVPVVLVDCGNEKNWFTSDNLGIISDKIDPNRSFLTFKQKEKAQIDYSKWTFKISST